MLFPPTTNDNSPVPIEFPKDEHQVENVVLDDADSKQSAISYFLPISSPYNYPKQAYTSLIGEMLESYGYNVLRNQLQLGYSVGARVVRIGDYSGILVTVESGKHPIELENIILNFFCSFSLHLHGMAQGDFQKRLASPYKCTAAKV